MTTRAEVHEYSRLKEQVLSSFVTETVSHLLTPFDKVLKKIHLGLSEFAVLVIFEGFLACLVFVIWILSGVSVKPGGWLWVLWGNMLTAICIFLVNRNLDSFLSSVDSHADKLIIDSQSIFTQWLDKMFDLRRQVTVSFVFALFIFPITVVFFDHTIGLIPTLLGSFVLFFNMWMIGNGFYWILLLPTSANAIFHSSKIHGYVDPKNTTWINAFSDVYERAAMSVSVIGVLVLVSLVPAQTPTIKYISFGWLLLLLGLITVPFLYASSYLSKLIKAMRYSMMTVIQQRIVETFHLEDRRNVGVVVSVDSDVGQFERKANTDKLDDLLKIYDLVKHSESSLLKQSATLQFANSFFLPIVSFLIINYTQVVSILQDMLNLLFP